jgi:8-oxo-dGTP pyrophosphatase MutT (NUDIX family)
MIKIYFKNRCVCLSKKEQSNKHSFNKDIHEIDDLNIEINRFLFNDHLHRFHIFGKKSSKLIKLFEERIPTINAGGGLVMNNRGEYLFIYRRKHWDLPKGKQELNEDIEKTALREVSEECGLSFNSLEILNKIDCSYHIYQNDPGFILKKTTWYLMQYSGDEVPVPEIEEGITKAEWHTQDSIEKLMKRTYPNIKELIRNIDFTKLNNTFTDE